MFMDPFTGNVYTAEQAEALGVSSELSLTKADHASYVREGQRRAKRLARLRGDHILVEQLEEALTADPPSDSED